MANFDVKNPHEHYSHEIRGDRFFQMTVPNIINKMEAVDSPYLFKNGLLSLLQSYYYGLVEYPEDNRLSVQGIESLCEMGIDVVGSFYNGTIDMKNFVNHFPLLDEIKKKDWRSQPILESKCRHLSSKENRVYEMAHFLPGLLPVTPDVIVPIVSDGFEPALLLANIYENADFLPIRLSWASRGDLTPLHPYDEKTLGARIVGRNVLLVEGEMTSGKTMLKMARYIEERNPSRIFMTAGNPTGTRLLEKTCDVHEIANRYDPTIYLGEYTQIDDNI